MDILYSIIILATLYQITVVQGIPVTPLRPIDDLVRVQLIRYTQGRGFADGLVLASTIVEGGPVYGRRRRILGGKPVHPGLDGLDLLPPLESCPPFSLGYSCLDYVPGECQVTRHLFLGSGLCTCKVDVCRR